MLKIIFCDYTFTKKVKLSMISGENVSLLLKITFVPTVCEIIKIGLFEFSMSVVVNRLSKIEVSLIASRSAWNFCRRKESPLNNG